MVTGALPTFFDVSNTFTAGALGDDNLVDQLIAAGKKLVGGVAVHSLPCVRICWCMEGVDAAEHGHTHAGKVDRHINTHMRM
jgi:hypothetical protein